MYRAIVTQEEFDTLTVIHEPSIEQGIQYPRIVHYRSAYLARRDAGNGKVLIGQVVQSDWSPSTDARRGSWGSHAKSAG